MSRDLPPPINGNETKSDNKGFMAKLSKSAGAATKLVALQGERTKLNTLTLPAAYRALGKDCLQQKRHLDCVPELTSQLRSVLAEIKQLSESATTPDTPQSFTDKAKAAGKQAADFARQKQLGMKRDSIIAGVGKGIYEQQSAASGPIELVAPIQKSLARIAQLDAEIGQQSQIGKGSVLTPKRMLLGVGVVLIVFMANWLLRSNSSDGRTEQTQSVQQSPATQSMMSLSQAEESRLTQLAKDGKQIVDEAANEWSKVSAGSKSEKDPVRKKFKTGFEKLMIVVNADYPLKDRTLMSEVYGTVIDFSLDRAENRALAVDVAVKSLRHNILPVTYSDKASSVLDTAKAKLKEEQQKDDNWLENYNKNDRGKKDGIKAGGGQTEDRDELVERIQIGISRNSVINILGQPDLAMPLGQGQAMLYYLSDTEAFFISIDKNGNVFSADRQERSE